MVVVTFAWGRLSGDGHTIYEALKHKLGREPTHREQCDEVKRILSKGRKGPRAWQ